MSNSLYGSRVFLRAGLIAACVLLVSGTADAENALGKSEFTTCAACHGENGEGNKLVAAPAIAGMDKWYIVKQLEKFKAGIRGKHYKDVEGLRMGSMAVTLGTAAEVDAVAEYVTALPVVATPVTVKGGDATKGQMGYMMCMACHGMKGEGNPAVGVEAPALTSTHDWYYLTQMKKMKAEIRGGAHDVEVTRMMSVVKPAVIAAGNFEEQNMKDILAYLETLKKK